MTNEQLGNLLAAFADFYWAIPFSYVANKIKTWHPEVTEQQFKGVLKKCDKDLYCYHCCVETKGVAEPELVAEHLLACGNDLENFLAVRKDLPICEYDEETLLAFHDELPDIPESQAIVTFVMKELGEKRGKDLAEEIRFMQNCALCEGDSWVKSILKTWQYGEKTFKTLEQVKQCRELGNKLYQVMPNPVLRGWKPTDIANAPVPKDDIPDRDEDIPHIDMPDFFDQIGEMEHIEDTVMQRSFEARQKIGRNDPCPCGSGKNTKSAAALGRTPIEEGKDMKKEISCADGRKLKLRILSYGKGAGILWIHGGGYVLGSSAMVHVSMGKALAKRYGGVVISPEYRLAKKSPYPAALEDCYAALKYMYEHAEALGIDRKRIVVGGESAGGGLAAALCQYARDRGEVPVAFQVPLYPMLDCEDTESSRDNHAHVWNTKRNHWGWRWYLGELYGTGNVPPYASPARATDYSHLPPCYTYVEDGEVFYDETLRYVQNLKEAGIEAHVDVFHGNIHAFDALLWTENSKEARRRLMQAAEKYLC